MAGRVGGRVVFTVAGMVMEVDEATALGLVAEKLAGKVVAVLAGSGFTPAEALVEPAVLAVLDAARAAGVSRPVSVARTMAEAGVVCGRCSHPFGRHEVEVGCLAMVDVRVGKAPVARLPCGCLGRGSGPGAGAAVAA